MKPTHLLAVTLTTALILACLAAPAAALAGSGTEANPYLISSLADLQSFRDSVNAGADTTGKYWKLTTDINLPSTNWDGIGSYNNPFNGVFDGDGHIIYNLYYSGTYSSSNSHIGGIGFFAVSTGTIKNLGFDNAYIQITSNQQTAADVGIVAGSGGGVISNCYVTNSEIVSSFSQYNKYTWGGFIIGILWESAQIDNCYVLNCQYSNTGTSPAGFGGISALISSMDSPYTITNCYVANSDIITATSSGNLAAGILPERQATSSYLTITNNIVTGSTIQAYNKNKIIAITLSDTNYNINNNYGSNTVLLNGATSTASNVNDGTYILDTDITESFYDNTLGWDFANTWYWDDSENFPKLQVFKKSVLPTISAISATPATGGQLTEYTLSVTASTEATGGIASYQWSYSTDSGTTWQPISGATTATYIWTPGTSISGTVLLKCYITGADGGTVDSYEAGYTNIQITVYPPPDISTISVSRPLQKVNTPTTLTATLAESEPATYQWYYSTNGGQTWQPISGATALTAEYTPTTTGTHSVKIVVTNTYGESNELTTNFNVLPTYTPTQISNTSVDINIPGTAKYQGQTQFTLSSELKALEYFDTDRAHLAHDNALYYLDSAERQIIPLAATTGNTISSCYIGQYTGVITDISGNTAFYNYQTNTWQYIEQLSADILASTTTYAATISGTTLNLYNLNGNKVDDIETTLTNLAGNDAANTFAGYSGKTLTYYWLSGNQLSSGSQTLAHTITDVHQVPGTENYVVSTTANTYIVSISNTGAYSQVMETETADPLLHTQATTINVLIGVSDPNEIYVVGSDGETDGTYVSGSTLTDASIAKSTGLYAIAGGADFQAYILGKSESSTWQLTQVISFGEAVDYSQVSTTGTYAAVATGLKLYLLEAVDVSTGTYMLQGAVIGSSGSPYAGKLITINGDQIRTDTSGRFLYPVSPGTLYTIIADTTEVEYTATNAALQQIAIKMKPNPYAQSVSYSAEYNEDTSSFEMQYEDQTGKTESVTWVIRESGNSTTVWTGTSTPGQTISWEVPFDKVFTGYQISMIADRSGSNVENVWMITPAGSQPIDIGGLDDTGKNIIFGCVLMVLAGLFGVMYSTKGALFIVLAAGVMVFLGLLTIPWEVIIVAGLLAVLALLAKGGGGS